MLYPDLNKDLQAFRRLEAMCVYRLTVKSNPCIRTQSINNKKLRSCCDSRSYCLRLAVIADRTAYVTVYWQTIKPVSVTSLRMHVTGDPSSWTHLNSIYSSVTIQHDTPKFSGSRSQWITERNTTSARLIVSKKLTFVFFGAFGRWTIAYYSWYNFWPCPPTLTATIHSVTDRQTGRTDRR